MVTIDEIAEAAGVSPSTVSRSFTAPDMVNAQTRQRVRTAAERMGYLPNRVARPSARKISTLGLIVPDIANPFFPPIIKAVQSRARQRGWTILLADTDERAVDELELARVMADQADGLLIVSARTPPEKFDEIRKRVPVVFVNRPAPGSPSVIIDNAEGVTQAVQSLHALGHTKIAYLSGPRTSWSNELRWNAIRLAAEDLGMDLTRYGPFEPQVNSGFGAADLLISSGMTGIIAYDDMIALGALARFAERGLRAGKDVSVIGIDDSPMAILSHPTLTTVHVPGAEAGVAAVDLLLEVLANPAATSEVKFESYLVVRDSTGPAPHPS